MIVLDKLPSAPPTAESAPAAAAAAGAAPLDETARRAMMAQILDAAFPGLGHCYAGATRSGVVLLAITLASIGVLVVHAARILQTFFAERVLLLPSILWTVALLAYGVVFTILVVTDALSFGQPDRPPVTRLERLAAWSGLTLLVFLWGLF